MSLLRALLVALAFALVACGDDAQSERDAEREREADEAGLDDRGRRMLGILTDPVFTPDDFCDTATEIDEPGLVPVDLPLPEGTFPVQVAPTGLDAMDAVLHITPLSIDETLAFLEAEWAPLGWESGFREREPSEAETIWSNGEVTVGVRVGSCRDSTDRPLLLVIDTA